MKKKNEIKHKKNKGKKQTKTSSSLTHIFYTVSLNLVLSFFLYSSSSSLQLRSNRYSAVVQVTTRSRCCLSVLKYRST